MKEKCDNHCETCPIQGQIYCALQYVKSLNDRVTNIENNISFKNKVLQSNPKAINVLLFI